MAPTKDRKPIEDWMHVFAFCIPIILFAIGTYILWKANYNLVSTKTDLSQPQDSTGTEISIVVKVQGRINADTSTIPCCVAVVEKQPETEAGEVEMQIPPNEAYQYFLLGSIIFIVLLILPRLKELTISKGSISIVLQDALNEVEDLRSQVESNKQVGIQTISNGVDIKVRSIKDKIELARKILARQ